MRSRVGAEWPSTPSAGRSARVRLLSLAQEPPGSVLLHFFVFRVPQDRDHVSWTEEADSPFAVVVCPRSFGRVAAPAHRVRIIETVFVDTSGQHVLRILIVGHVVLFVGD